MNDSAAPGCTNPADGSPLEPVKSSTAEEVQAAVAKARAAQPAWAQRSLEERSRVLLAFAQSSLERWQAGAKIIASETGRSETECLMSELASSVEFAKSAIRAGKKALADEPVKLSPLDYPGKKIVIEAVPRGVVGIIAPWNYPFGNFLKSFYPALLAGNGVVMKPSEHSPRSGAWLHSLTKDLFPDGLIGLVQGGGDVGAMLLDADIDSIIFTGSVATGRKIAAKAGEKLIPCSVELGGKDAAVVLADCNLDRTVAGVAQWGLHNAGQNCAAIERVFVEASIADQFVDRLGKAVGSLRVAPQPGHSDLGPLQNAAQLEIVKRHVEDAKAKGAVLVTGGEPTGQGFGFQPTVLDQCTDDMLVMREETFGPVLAVARVSNAEEGIRRANDCVYGLNGSIWTQNTERGASLARQLEVGVALVNNHAITGVQPETPWTGVKQTGFGVASSRFAYPSFVRRRTVFVDKNKNPDPWWFPFNDDLRQFGEALVARGLGSLGAILKLAGLLKKRVEAIRAFSRGTS